MSQGFPVSRQHRFPLVPGMIELRQFPTQQSVSELHSHCPVLQRLESATVQLSLLIGSAQVDPPSVPKPESPPLFPLQFPLQQSLLSEHGSLTATQQETWIKFSQTAPFAPAWLAELVLLEPVGSHGLPEAAMEKSAAAKIGMRRFIEPCLCARSAPRRQKAERCRCPCHVFDRLSERAAIRPFRGAICQAPQGTR
jgi:hypothetical protein